MSSQQSLKRLASKISPAHQSFKRFASKLSPSGPQHTQLLKELFPGAIIAPSIQNRQIMDKLTLIDTYLSLGKLDQAEMIFHQTWRRSPLRVKDLINPGLINKFIRELLLQGKLAKALYWFNNMSSYHVSPNIHTFAILISYYLSSSQIAQAQELIDSIKDKFNLTDLLVTPEFLEDPQLTQSLEALLEAPNEQSLLQSALLQEFKHPDNKNSDYKITQLRLPNSPMVAFLDAALNAFKDTSAIEAYHRQMLLEQHCFVANMKVENLKESRLPDALKTAVSNFPTHMIRNWQASIAAATKNYIENLTEKNPKEPVLQFLSLFTPEKLAAVTISRFLHVPNRTGKDGTSDLSTKTYALSGKIALSIGGALELENNLKEMSRQKNRKMVKEILN
jgi:pentatricopeptide repeat protein